MPSTSGCGCTWPKLAPKYVLVVVELPVADISVVLTAVDGTWGQGRHLVVRWSVKSNLKELQTFFDSSISHLEDKVSKLKEGDEKLAYYRSLLILTKKVELELETHLKGVEGFWKSLDEMHDYVHEIFPG